jgi:hypothetical protein
MNRSSPDLLIFSDKLDLHTEIVLKRLRHDIRCRILNLDQYNDAFTFEWTSSEGLICRLNHDNQVISFEGVKSVWWRRPFGVRRQRLWPNLTSGLNPWLGLIFGERFKLFLREVSS